MQKISPSYLLQIGIGLVLIYAGAHSFIDATNWIQFVPNWISSIISSETFLVIYSIFEMLIGIFIIFGLFTKITLLIASLNFFLILILYGVTDYTFPLFGILMATISLFFLSKNKKNPEQ